MAEFWNPPDTRGDPMSPLRWTTKSTRNLAAELTRQGHRVGADTVGDLLREEGFSLQGNAKTIEGNQVPDRDAQFRYLNEQVREHRDAGEPVISVDTKKKELVGNYRNGGREWRPAGEPVHVKDHDFPDQELGKAIPYGIYDLAADAGWVNVGTDHDTAGFAVESIRRWWEDQGVLIGPTPWPHDADTWPVVKPPRLPSSIATGTPCVSRLASGRRSSGSSRPAPS